MEERGDDHLQTNERNIFQGFHFFEESLPSTFSLGEPLLENPVWERKWKDRRAGTKAIHFDGEVLCIEYSKKKKHVTDYYPHLTGGGLDRNTFFSLPWFFASLWLVNADPKKVMCAQTREKREHLNLQWSPPFDHPIFLKKKMYTKASSIRSHI